jgi:hypothetical protein
MRSLVAKEIQIDISVSDREERNVRTNESQRPNFPSLLTFQMLNQLCMQERRVMSSLPRRGLVLVMHVFAGLTPSSGPGEFEAPNA